MELKEILDGLQKDFVAFKDANDTRIKEIEAKGVADPITVEKVQKIEKSLDSLAEMRSQIEQLEILAKRPRIDGKGDEFTKEQREHKDAFEAFMRNPKSSEANTKLALAQKAVATTTDAAGGYAVPEIIARQITEKLQDISPMRQLVRVVSIGSSDYKELVDVNGEGYTWVGEGTSRSETDTSTLAQVTPTMGTIYAYVKASEESLDDIFFDVSSWLVNKSVRAFARGEGAAFVSGNGTNKPTGFLNGTPVSTGDEDSPARTFGVLQYIPSGTAGGFGSLSLTSPVKYPGDCLIDTVHSLKSGYTAGAKWTMNRSTMGTIRKFKDGNGEYLFQMSNNDGEMGVLLGYPIVEMPDMPDIGSNTFPVAFGNFEEGYLAVDRVGLRISVDDNITAPGFKKWYLRKRVGGKLKNDDAIKLVKMAAS